MDLMLETVRAWTRLLLCPREHQKATRATLLSRPDEASPARRRLFLKSSQTRALGNFARLWGIPGARKMMSLAEAVRRLRTPATNLGPTVAASENRHGRRLSSLTPRRCRPRDL